MKKLKLKSLEFSGAEVLTREQLKNVFGGGSCDMYYQDSSGQWRVDHGSCTTTASNSSGFWGPGSMFTDVVSYCQTPKFPNPVPLSSNGGQSRC